MADYGSFQDGIYAEGLLAKHRRAPGTDPDKPREALTADDLIPIQANNDAVKPRAPQATSIPAVLKLLQDEWDALMLETYTVKQHYETLRKELSHALYQARQRAGRGRGRRGRRAEG